MSRGRVHLIGAALSVLIVSLFGIGIAGAHSITIPIGRTHSTGPMVLPMKVNATASKNYYVAGWAVSSSSTVSNVKGSWIVPRVHGTCGSATTEADLGVGIGGYSGSTATFAAAGVILGCYGGSAAYGAWYEFGPYVGLTSASTLTIHPGNVIYATVSGSTATHWVLKLTDLNTSKSFSKTYTYSGGRDYAVWTVGVTTYGATPVYKLPNFGTIDFGRLYTSVNKTSDATIGGHTGSIAYLVKHGATATIYTMVKYTGTAVMASTSQIKSDGQSFTVTWKSAGP